MLENKIIAIAKNAGDEIMKFYKASDLLVESKSDSSPVTQADLNAHQIIFSGLRALSNDFIISEESDLDKSMDLRDKRFWLVDPLDGTRDFVAGHESFCVSIALIENCQPILGVLYSPVLNEIFYAKSTEGAFFNGKKIFNSSKRTKLFALSSRAKIPSERMKGFLKKLNIEKIKPYGSALKFGHLARGDADIYPRFGETSEWDTAAGQIICQEAGCAVLNISTLETLQYAKNDFLNSGFIAVREDLIPSFQNILLDM